MLSISVILPVYNGAKYLKNALDSVSSQGIDLSTIEIIATDDDSTDGSREILAAASASLPITVISGACKGNWVASTNLALARAKGEFISFLHQDDRYLPNKLKALLAAAKQHPDANIFAHPVDFINSEGRAIGTWRFPAKTSGWRLRTPPIQSLQAAEWFRPLLVQNNLAVPGVMFRRSLLNDVGPLDETLRYTADWDFWLRLASQQKLVLLRETLAEYRIHQEAQTVNFAEKQTEYGENLQTVVNRHIDKIDIFPDTTHHKAKTYRSLAYLGNATNLWLASHVSTNPQSFTTLIGAIWKAGLWNAVHYPRLSQIRSRVLARLKARVNPRSSSENSSL